MDIKQAREYCRLGLLTRAKVKTVLRLGGEGFVIEFGGVEGVGGQPLEKARGKERVFKTLDAAANAVWDIGFKSFEVVK